MGTIALRRLALACATFVLSIGCGGTVSAYRGRQAEIGLVARYWVDPAAGPSDWFVQRSCERWERLGIRCLPMAERDEARIEIVSDGKPCVAEKDKDLVLATAAPIGGGRWRIKVNTDCFSPKRTTRPRLRRGLNLTHEFGHTFGVGHVPAFCGGPSIPRTAAGTRICGRAIMNHSMDDGVFVITVQDAMMFRLRDVAKGALEPSR